MVNFENGMVVAQFFGNYGMLEIYVGIFSGLFLYLSSLAVIFVSLGYGKVMKDRVHLIGDSIGPGGIKLAERGIPGWQFVSAGIFFTGLVGIGEVMKHLLDVPILFNFLDYLTLISPPAALYFFYIGIKKHLQKEIGGVILKKIIITTLILFDLVGGLAVSAEYYGADIKNFFLYLILVPVLIFSAIVFRAAFRAYEKYLLFIPAVSAMVLSTALLALVTFAVQLSVIFEYAGVFIIVQGVKDILLSVTATSILAYGGGIRMMKIRRM